MYLYIEALVNFKLIFQADVDFWPFFFHLAKHNFREVILKKKNHRHMIFVKIFFVASADKIL